MPRNSSSNKALFVRLKRVFSLAVLMVFIPSSYGDTVCDPVNPCTIDVAVAYTHGAERWANDPQSPFSCDKLISSDSNLSGYRAVKLATEGEEGVFPIYHPCEMDSFGGELVDFVSVCHAEPELNCQNDSHDVCLAHPSLDCRQDPSIQNLAAVSMAELNQIYRNSGVGYVRFNLVATHKLMNEDGLPYEEGSWKTPLCNHEVYYEQDLNCERHRDLLARSLSAGLPLLGELVKARNLDKAPYAMREVNVMRQEKNADIVILLVKEGYDDNLLGIATGTGVLDAKNGFAALEVNHATAPTFTFAHEVSHLLAAGHDERQSILNVIASDPVSVFGHNDNRGYYTGIDGEEEITYQKEEKIRTIMSYGCQSDCTTIPFLSSNTVQVQVKIPSVEDSTEFEGSKNIAIGSATRNNALVVSGAAVNVARFSEELPNLFQETSTTKNNEYRIAIDFGYETWYRLNYKTLFTTADETSSPYWGVWNNITNRKRGTKIGSLVGIEDVVVTTRNHPTSIEIEIVNSFAGRSSQSFGAMAIADFGLDELPPMAAADGFYAVYPFDAGEIAIRGLDATKKYHFKAFTSGNTMGSVRNGELTFKGVENTKVNVVSTPNFYRAIHVDGIQPVSSGTGDPTADGVVKVHLNAAGPWWFSRSTINSLEFWPDDQ